MGWPGLILTDSGGFQIFSLAHRTKITDEGAVFQAHTDGRRLEMTPERSLEIQRRLGSDIAMVLDHVVALPNEMDRIHDACQRTILWAKRSREYMSGLHGKEPAEFAPAVFAIVQGGLDAELRARCAESLVALDFDGYAIGGLSVGESPNQMYQMLNATCPYLPVDRARYLMGVGRPEDILEAIRRGIDMFDCVIPTRNGRNALAFTDRGPVRLRNQIHQRDSRPLEPDCPCAACRRSRGYLRHLFQSGEMLGPILLSIHNLTYYQRLMSQARTAIENSVFEEFYQRKMAGWAAHRNS
jgi:queuine tRNA-ribosyltransferase